MKAYSFITGRGPISGYGFVASSPNIPHSAPWMSGHRASDTPGQVPIVEMQCAGFRRPVFISSRWVVDSRPFGYTEYLVVPVPQDAEEKKALLAQPGRMLYYPFVGKDAFMALDTPGSGGQARMPVEDIELPSAPSGKQTRMPENMLASLLSDVWANSFIRLSGRKYDPLRLNLSRIEEIEQAQQEGIRFLNEVILPSLPEPVRHTISVSIGGYWGSLPKAENGGAPALAITIPEDQGFQMPGGYDLVHEQFNMRYQPDFAEVGRALLRNENLEYYRDWCEKKPEHRLLVNFFAALSLVHISVSLKKGDLNSLLFAYRHYQQLETLLSNDYQDISAPERRKLCLKIEEDLLLALTKVVDVETVYPDNMVKHLVKQAFSLREELKGQAEEAQLGSIEDAYAILLSRPGAPKDGGKEPPAYALFTDREQRDKVLHNNASLYYNILEKGLEHARQEPLAQFAAIRELYSLPMADKPRLAGIISKYVITGLGNGFDIAHATNAQLLLAGQADAMSGLAPAVVQRFAAGLPEYATDSRKLNEAFNFLNALDESTAKPHSPPRSEAVNKQFLEAVDGYIQNHPDEQGINLRQLFSAAELLRPHASNGKQKLAIWLSDSHMTEAVCAILRRRGQANGSVLYPAEADLLIKLMDTQKGCAPALIKAALDPLAAQPLTEQTMQSLGKLLPHVYPALPADAPRDGWLVTWKRMLLDNLKICIRGGSEGISVLLHPQSIWKAVCPIKEPALDNLDQLSNWHLEEAELVHAAEAPLMDVLTSLSQNNLSDHLPNWHPGQGWFSQLLEQKMRGNVIEDKYHQFLNHQNSYEDILSMERLLRRYNEDQRFQADLDALRFVIAGPSENLGPVLSNYYGLKKCPVAGRMLDNLLNEAPTQEWNHHIDDIRIAMAFMTVTSHQQPPEEAIPEFLNKMDIDMEQVHKMNPWDDKEGFTMLSTFLNIIRWFESAGMDNLSSALANYLESSKFTRKVRGKQKKHVFAPMIGDKKTPKAPVAPGLSAWLNL